MPALSDWTNNEKGGRNMSTTKKNGQAEESLQTNQLVDTLWNQYEQSLDRARKIRESREDAYLNAVKEVVKFNQEFRFSLGNLYRTFRNTNSELVKGVSNGLVKEEAKKVVRPELKEQIEEVNGRIEQLVAAPIAAGLDLVARTENSFIENSEKYVEYSRARRGSWQQVTDGYVKAARKSHQQVVNRLEESVKVFVNAK
jgi:hypothetical protein